MTLFESKLHWITGMMFGIEFLSGSDYEKDLEPVQWGLVLDLAILRIVILVREGKR